MTEFSNVPQDYSNVPQDYKDHHNLLGRYTALCHFLSKLRFSMLLRIQLSTEIKQKVKLFLFSSVISLWPYQRGHREPALLAIRCTAWLGLLHFYLIGLNSCLCDSMKARKPLYRGVAARKLSISFVSAPRRKSERLSLYFRYASGNSGWLAAR